MPTKLYMLNIISLPDVSQTITSFSITLFLFSHQMMKSPLYKQYPLLFLHRQIDLATIIINSSSHLWGIKHVIHIHYTMFLLANYTTLGWDDSNNSNEQGLRWFLSFTWAHGFAHTWACACAQTHTHTPISK